MNIRACLMLFAITVLAALGTTSCEKSSTEAARENTDLTSQKILSIDDDDFLTKAEKSEITQTTLSRLALHKSDNEDVRRFARQVITNYERALADLRDLMKAKNKGDSPAGIEDLRLEAMNRLQGLSGSAFDHEFVSLIAAEQQETLANFNAAAETAEDSDIRNYANGVLPLLREDFDSAIALEKKLNANNGR